MRMDRKEMKVLTNELESLVNKSGRTMKETQRMNELRKVLGFKQTSTTTGKKFLIEEYIRLKKANKDLTDRKIAQIMGVTIDAVDKGKRRHGVSSYDFN